MTCDEPHFGHFGTITQRLRSLEREVKVVPTFAERFRGWGIIWAIRAAQDGTGSPEVKRSLLVMDPAIHLTRDQ